MANRIEVIGGRTYEFERDAQGVPLQWRLAGGEWQSSRLDHLPALDRRYEPSDRGWKDSNMCGIHACYAVAAKGGHAVYCERHSMRP